MTNQEEHKNIFEFGRDDPKDIVLQFCKATA